MKLSELKSALNKFNDDTDTNVLIVLHDNDEVIIRYKIEEVQHIVDNFGGDYYTFQIAKL